MTAYGPMHASAATAALVLLVVLWFIMIRQMQTGGNKALSFGKARVRLVSDKAVKLTFADVAGVEEAKEELQEIIEFLKEPQKFQKLGGRIPKGVLLMGPPGTGKSHLAAALGADACDHGLTVAWWNVPAMLQTIKDSFDTAGVVTTAGTTGLANHVDVVARRTQQRAQALADHRVIIHH